MVGNGDYLRCNSYYTDIPVCLGSTKFHIDLYILPTMWDRSRPLYAMVESFETHYH